MVSDEEEKAPQYNPNLDEFKFTQLSDDPQQSNNQQFPPIDNTDIKPSSSPLFQLSLKWPQVTSGGAENGSPNMVQLGNANKFGGVEIFNNQGHFIGSNASAESKDRLFKTVTNMGVLKEYDKVGEAVSSEDDSKEENGLPGGYGEGNEEQKLDLQESVEDLSKNEHTIEMVVQQQESMQLCNCGSNEKVLFYCDYISCPNYKQQKIYCPICSTQEKHPHTSTFIAQVSKNMTDEWNQLRQVIKSTYQEASEWSSINASLLELLDEYLTNSHCSLLKQPIDHFNNFKST
ncbi:hypothetical protein FGO68_gene8757 [Halteria grandinella]|uniref:Uncharacterized protein n=1 Tax=Halteria grandinella TaxID=5974 RepID=A0A8J8T4X9_HALGN|nr:hypothetical protein FGO68_gene8757 [Halteria grandinella]